jgi:hypothetical protein
MITLTLTHVSSRGFGFAEAKNEAIQRERAACAAAPKQDREWQSTPAIATRDDEHARDLTRSAK